MATNIELRGLGKRYIDRQRVPTTLREAITGVGRIRRRREQGDAERPWALSDVTLDVEAGTCLGVIGRNGSGKTTLLKVLAGITEPTEGVARVRAPVGSLLEVGTGFHPELTGRENVFLNGAVLGMSRQLIQSRFDEIVAFAGVEDSLDIPLKHYSSGMGLRLAFAVAAFLPSTVLLVDEVLAVGDVEFQRRCLEYLSGAETAGRTVVFVSHDLEAVTRLCAQSVWLDRGKVVATGSTSDVVAAYLGSTVDIAASSSVEVDGGPLRLSSVAVLDPRGQVVSSVLHGQPFRIQVRFTLGERVPGFDIGVYLERDGAIRVLDELLSDVARERPSGPGSYVALIEVPPVLNVGLYHVGVWSGATLGTTFEEFLDVPDLLRFRIDGQTAGRDARLIELNLSWSVIEHEDPE